jgi:hypothetical protein
VSNSTSADSSIEIGGFVEPDENELELDQDQDIITELFDPTQIRVDTRQLTIDLVLNRIEHKELDLAPEFQRQADIWTKEAKSRLIESILIRIPLPAFYVDATNEEKWLVIDGLQRLSTLKQFVLDQKLQLTGLEFLSNLENHTYEQLPRNYQRRIKETQLTIYVIEQGTPPEVKFNIFRRINTGGEPLSPQELRHALNPGKAPKILYELANSTEFTQVVKLSEKRKSRRDDQEFVLGFIAFKITYSKDYKNGEIKKYRGRDYFFNHVMIELNKMKDEDIETLKEQFYISMNRAYKIFGDYAFRKISKKKTKTSPLNKSLFEAWSFILSELEFSEFEILCRRKDKLLEKFMEKRESDEEFEKSISQAALKVEYRLKIINQIVQETLSS